jgi:hypothetical protein
MIVCVFDSGRAANLAVIFPQTFGTFEGQCLKGCLENANKDKDASSGREFYGAPNVPQPRF